MFTKIKTIVSAALFITTVIVGAVTIVNWLSIASVKLAEEAVEYVRRHRTYRLILASRDKEMER